MEVTGDSPIYVKEKIFQAVPLTLAQALDEMELVGHDFFLYLDQDSKRPSVCLLYTSPSPRDRQKSRMPSSA